MFVDPSHICGRRDLLKDITQEAFNVGYEGAMIESHPNPDAKFGVMLLNKLHQKFWQICSEVYKLEILIFLVLMMKWEKQSFNF